MPPKDLEIEITNLSCASCVARAETALSKGLAADKVSVNLATKRAILPVRPNQDLRLSLQALSKAGYPAQIITYEYNIPNMNCASCVGRIEDALSAHSGVLKARANLADKTLWVETVDAEARFDTYVQTLTDIGFEPTQHSATPEEPKSPTGASSEKRNALLAICLAMPLLVLEMGGHLFPAFHHWLHGFIAPQRLWLLQCALASALILGPAREIFKRGLPNLWRGHPDMNSLVALASLAAWGYSSLVLVAPSAFPTSAQHVYFEAAGIILALILLGRWMEARAKSAAADAISSLMRRLPDTATVERAGVRKELPIAQIALGDHVLIPAGGRIPVDGTLISGVTEVDEAMMTGEPLPIAKTKGDLLIGGTVNGNGAITLEASAIGADTALARIVQTVKRAQAGKLPIQNLADQITRRFVPAVLLIAATSCLLWLGFGPAPKVSHALVAAVSVLIIACPCAMGLATPMSVMVGSGRGASLGVLFRKGSALQQLGEVKLVAFDKTGTLTEGAPRIATTHCIPEMDQNTALIWASALEARSAHPIAQAFQSANQDVMLPQATRVTEHPGGGIEGHIEEMHFHLGSAKFLQQQSISAAALADQAKALSETGQTPVFLAKDAKVIACFGLSDTIKPSAQRTVQALQAQGIACAMITGDRADVADIIAHELGISIVRAEVSPEGKADCITTLQQDFGKVAFVGDGINDAPALAKADVGVALGQGMDVAVETADVILRDPRLSAVLTAIQLSSATLRNIKQNLFWAFAYNIILIPVAAGALYPLFGITFSPVFGAAAMALSSLFVVGNALRLRRFQARSVL